MSNQSVLTDEQIREIVEPLAGHAIPDSIVAHFRAVADAAIAADRTARAEPVARIKDGVLQWYIPLADYSARTALLTGEHMLYTAPPAASVVPEGWKLVPVDLTREMIDAANSARGWVETDSLSRGCYRAMLAAAPAPIQEPTT